MDCSDCSTPWRRLSIARFSAALLVSASLSSPLAAQLVSANAHEANLRSGSTPALPGIAQLANVDANAYHVSSDTEVANALAYNAYNKPKILSDDAGGVTPDKAKRWIDSACDNGEHYEHFDGPIGANAMSGVTIDSIQDFPPDSIEVLEHIRDVSCASTLTPGGTLTRAGREFYWNGQQVSLVGSSWMGALSSKNFNPAGYLQVLADHHVNLTRVWVIEQWTAFLVNKPGSPHTGNAILPFAGAIDFSGSNDTLDLYQVNTAFLNRLSTFVSAAAARGIVVQLTLFDRHGLLNKPAPDDRGRWIWSPYNVVNNRNAQATAGASGKAPPAFVTSQCTGNVLMLKSNPPTFTGDEACVLRIYNEKLVESIVQKLASAGNVIYEIMNEPNSGEWGEQAITDWHAWVAAAVKAAI